MLIYSQEFIMICTHLKKIGCMEKRGFLIVEKPQLEELMNKNAYETSANKLKIWKALHWIDTDDDRVTRRIYVARTHSYRAVVKIDLRVCEMLQQLSGQIG